MLSWHRGLDGNDADPVSEAAPHKVQEMIGPRAGDPPAWGRADWFDQQTAPPQDHQ